MLQRMNVIEMINSCRLMIFFYKFNLLQYQEFVIKNLAIVLQHNEASRIYL